jgi:transcriptional regulator with XRE-family HTH domain
MSNFLIIRDLAEKKNMTIRKLANKIGVTESALHLLIKNGSTKTSTLEKIAKVLDVPVGYFFDEVPSNGNMTNTGSGNQVFNQSGTVTISECEKENAHLRQLLEEKEKQIELLRKMCELNIK